MIGYRIKIIKSLLDSYWYADHIGDEYWAYLDDDQNYVIVPEGTIQKVNSEFPKPRTFRDFGDKVVITEDCKVLRNSYIIADITTTSRIVEVLVKDLYSGLN